MCRVAVSHRQPYARTALPDDAAREDLEEHLDEEDGAHDDICHFEEAVQRLVHPEDLNYRP